MTQVTFNPPNLFCSDDDYVYELLNQKRGPNRKFAHHHIVIETLRLVTGGNPTKFELQKFSKIRRKRFLVVLKYLIDTGSVARTGQGTKRSPYRYSLSEKELQR